MTTLKLNVSFTGRGSIDSEWSHSGSSLTGCLGSHFSNSGPKLIPV